MTNQNKYRAGDLVTIKINTTDANTLNAQSHGWWKAVDIVSHTPAPFDWAGVKPGMAFYCGQAGILAYYIGPSPMEYKIHYLYSEGIIVNFRCEYLTRAREHDIEVAT